MHSIVTVQNLFTLDMIAQTYEERIRPKSGRGIDRISVLDFEKNKEEHFKTIQRKCLNSTFRFSPYLQRLILKGADKPPRTIAIPTVRDKIVLSILNKALQKAFPKSLKRELPNVKVRNLANAIQKSQGMCDLHRVDVEKYYDSIDISLLLKQLKGSTLDDTILLLLSRAVRNPTVPEGYRRKERTKYYRSYDKGVPQGLPISNILAEIYLRGADIVLSKKTTYYDRYVDDIISLTTTDVHFKSICQDVFRCLGLKFNTGKTDFCSEDECFNYLGYTIAGNTITIKKRTLERYLHSISMMFVRFRKAVFIDSKRQTSKIGIDNIKNAFLEDLNIKISGAKFQNKRYGWLQYFSEINDESIPYLIDNFIHFQFLRCQIFNEIPEELKYSSRTFYEIKYNWRETKYIHNYELADLKQRRAWLTTRGLALGSFSKDEIDRLYSYHVGRFLNQIEKDMGVEYKI